MSQRMSRRVLIGALPLLALAGCIPAGVDDRVSDDRPPPPDREDRTPYDRDDRSPRERDDDVAPAPPAPTPASPTPAWQPRTVVTDAMTVRDGITIVQPGDTLRAIGERTGAGSEALARANDLEPPFVIRAGQRLTVPGGRYHLVRAGETGIAIARAYQVPWARVVAANQLSEPYILRVGMRVLIPDSDTELAPAAVAATPPPSREVAPNTPAPARSALAERAARFQLDIDDILTGGEPAIAANQTPTPPRPAGRPVPPTAVVAAPPRLSGGFDWPLHGRILARFGPGASGERFNGIKIATPLDTPVAAAADGVVAYAGSEIPSLGGLVILRHGDNWVTVYGHCSRLLVQRGQRVRRGQIIARSGDTGFADRPELHFEMRRGRTPVDPLGQLPRV